MLKFDAPPMTLAMRAPPRAQLADALKAKTEHALRPTGYYRAGQIDVRPVLGVKTGGMKAPGTIANGSMHFLQPPGKRDPIKASWITAEAAWEIPGGHRMAFKNDYLDAHGWSYGGPAPPED